MLKIKFISSINIFRVIITISFTFDMNDHFEQQTNFSNLLNKEKSGLNL